MANGFTPQMYSEGAVVFDSTPSVRMAEQIMNRQLAKQEALDKYFNDLNKSFNPAGMRTQDTPFFMQKTNELREFYSKHKDAIRNPQKDLGQAQNEYYSRYQDILNTINQSKQEGEKIKGVASVLADPDKRSRIPESVLNEISIHDLPLNDPNRKSFNTASLTFDPKPFGVKEQQAYLKGAQEGLKMDERISVGPTDPRTMMQTLTTTSSFGPEAKGAIHNRAAAAYGSDTSFKSFVDKMSTNPQLVNDLNKIFREQYGADIETPEDVAAAWTLQSVQRERQTQKAQADWKARQDYMQGQKIALLNKGESMKKAGDAAYDSWLDQYIDFITEEGLGVEGPAEMLTPVDQIQMDPIISKALARDGKEPDGVSIRPDGKYVPLFFKRDSEGMFERDENGNRVVIESLSTPISRQQLKLALGGRTLTKKDLSNEMKATNTTKKSIEGKKNKYPLPSGKPRSVRQGGYTYTYNEETGKYE